MVVSQSGTDFSTTFGGPGEPPSGNTVPENPWAGNLIAFGAAAPPTTNGIGAGDSLTLSFGYTGSESALVAALIDNDGNSRMAAHILDCSFGNSCVGSAQPVPLPAALPLLLAALGGLRVFGRKRS